MKRKPIFQIFRSDAGGSQPWRWRLQGANGEILAQSEGYVSKANAKRATMRLGAIALEAAIAGFQ